jgi:large subunit ribosomal protein L3
MPSVKRPRKGSKAFYPKKRAKRIYPAVRSWASDKDAKLLGFAGYKAGMTHVGVIDANPNSRSKGQVLIRSVTVLDCPPLNVLGFCAHASYPSRVLCAVFSEKSAKNLIRKTGVGKVKPLEDQMKKMENVKAKTKRVSLMLYTTPGFKKTPEIFEIPIGGDLDSQLEYAKSMLGKQIKFSEIFKPGDFLDVSAVTKGKGFQGVVKRFGTKLQGRHNEQGHRIIGCLGSKQPGKIRSTVPRPGQLGFQTRTEVNKRVVKIDETLELKGGFLRYGKLSGEAVLVDGSVPGPTKRLIRLRFGVRPKKIFPVDVRYVSNSSKQGV